MAAHKLHSNQDFASWLSKFAFPEDTFIEDSYYEATSALMKRVYQVTQHRLLTQIDIESIAPLGMIKTRLLVD